MLDRAINKHPNNFHFYSQFILIGSSVQSIEYNQNNITNQYSMLFPMDVESFNQKLLTKNQKENINGYEW